MEELPHLTHQEVLELRDNKARLFVLFHDAFLKHRSECEACQKQDIKLDDCTIGHLAFLNMDNALQDLRSCYKVAPYGA